MRAAMEEFVISELVTKDYFDAKLAQLRAEFRGELAALEARLIRWMVGTVGGATVALIVTMLRALR
jgi:hypothetical protein